MIYTSFHVTEHFNSYKLQKNKISNIYYPLYFKDMIFPKGKKKDDYVNTYEVNTLFFL